MSEMMSTPENATPAFIGTMLIKPKAVRSSSYEVFLVGLDHKDAAWA
jgi:23S rRNA U2552 (ribose-2'-O)-methylase RlmE/FtsJ